MVALLSFLKTGIKAQKGRFYENPVVCTINSLGSRVVNIKHLSFVEFSLKQS